MLYGNNDLIDTTAIQLGDDVGAEYGSTTPPPPPPADLPSIDFDLDSDSIDIFGFFSVGDSGTMFGEMSFGVPSGGLQSITFGFYEGATFGSVSYDLDSGSLSQHFEHDFGNGIQASGDLSISTDGMSVSASVDWHF